MSPPIKVAVVGGGCAGIAAAFELSRPEHRGRYQVTVYQMGWRLGGKGASGRGPSGRIEEHGLHVWLGFYENAFRLIRECYAELGRDPATCPIADWRDAFIPDPHVGVAEDAEDDWSFWLAHFPPGKGLPGDLAPPSGLSVLGYLERAAELLLTLIQSVAPGSGLPPEQGSDASEESAGQSEESSAPGLWRQMERLSGYAELATFTALIEAARVLAGALRVVSAGAFEPLMRLIDAIARGLRGQLERRASDQPEIRRLWTVVDLVLAVLRGSLRFGLAFDPRGFDAINDYDWREWLRLNGAAEESLQSGFVRGIYDLCFAYEDGDVTRPRLAAGQALRGAMRMFMTYRGAFFWKMSAGMGDIVFAPFYEVLKRRGVRFEFFHRLDNVGLASGDEDGGDHVASLRFDVQARIEGGGEYQPLVDVRGLPCWPSRPLFEQLVDGAALERDAPRFESPWDPHRADSKELRVGRDFDAVVLAIGLGAVPATCREILSRDAHWRAMVTNVKTVATQAFQLWLSCDLEELGWSGPAPTLSAFVHPFDTWADMSHLIPLEDWPQAPKTIAYFCSVLPDTDAKGRDGSGCSEAARAAVLENVERFLEGDLAKLWPDCTDGDGRFRWQVLAASAPDPTCEPVVPGSARDSQFSNAQQYWSANVYPSDRYVQSLPGSIRYRISPLDRSYDNLSVAGDWTACGFTAGCVEAAFISGRLAAHSIARVPRLEDVVGFDGP